MQSISFAAPKFAGKDQHKPLKPKHVDTRPLKEELGKLVDQTVATLEKPEVQKAVQKVSDNLEMLKIAPQATPQDKLIVSTYQKTLPTNAKKLNNLVKGMTNGVKMLNNNISNPNFANHLADSVQRQAQDQAIMLQARLHAPSRPSPKIELIG